MNDHNALKGRHPVIKTAIEMAFKEASAALYAEFPNWHGDHPCICVEELLQDEFLIKRLVDNAVLAHPEPKPDREQPTAAALGPQLKRSNPWENV